jgi:ubiquinone/menaquinone biosynthesis C-methylase UbiE
MNCNNQAEYWNKVAKEKEFTTSLDLNIFSELINKNSLLIDYGCGYGRTLNELSSFGYKNLIGFDYSSKMIERGKKEYPDLDLRVSKDNKIDCPSNSVDIVFLFAVLTCIIDNETQKELIKEIKRVLKPNGFIYINDFLINYDSRNKKRYGKYADKYNNYGVFELSEGAVLRHHEKNWIFELTNEFERIYYKENTFKTMNENLSNGFVYFGKKNYKASLQQQI